MSFKFCLVGCGSFSNLFHGPAIREIINHLPSVEFAGCCDIVEDKAKRFRRSFDAAGHYTDIADMLDRVSPDAVLVAVPPPVTFAASRIVLERGIPLLLEKPPGLNTAQWSELTAIAGRTGTPTQVGFNRRYMPALTHALQILSAEFPPNAITQIEYAMIRFNRLSEDFSTTAIHALDTLLFLARSPLQEARFTFGAEIAQQPYRITMDATTVSGIHVHLDILPGAGRVSERICVHAIGQSLEVNVTSSPNGASKGNVDHWRNEGLVSSYSDTSTPALNRSGVYLEIAAFLTAISGKQTLPTPALADCHQQVALMEAIRERRTTPLAFPTGTVVL